MTDDLIPTGKHWVRKYNQVAEEREMAARLREQRKPHQDDDAKAEKSLTFSRKRLQTLIYLIRQQSAIEWIETVFDNELMFTLGTELDLQTRYEEISRYCF